MDRPEGCKFWTGDDVVKWIAENVPGDKLGSSTNEEAAIWWHACLLAEYFNDLSRKDMARELVEGIPAVGLDNITEELQIPYEDNLFIDAAGVAENDRVTEHRLREWFNV